MVEAKDHLNTVRLSKHSHIVDADETALDAASHQGLYFSAKLQCEL